MNTWIQRKWGTRPVPLTKYDITKTRDMQEYLNNSIPMQSDKLKIRLIKEGYLKPMCYNCGREEWEDEEIPLQLSHRDGDKYNNNLRNLELLCPNCHAQTGEWKLRDDFKGTVDSNENKKNRNTDV